MKLKGLKAIDDLVRLLSVSDFTRRYSSLSKQYPEWGDVATLPWDEEIFGFPVAEYRPGPAPPSRDSIPAFRDALLRYAATTEVRLVSVNVDPSHRAAIADLALAGFYFVDLNLEVWLHRLQVAGLPKSRASARRCSPEDHEEIYRIAGTAFSFGRYHADPRFPRELADLRYVRWMRNALNGDVPNDYVFVTGPPGKPFGFFDVVVEHDVADLRLGAMDPDSASGLGGYLLVVETLHELAQLGARSVRAKISAANTSMSNVYADLGFRFSAPQVVLHWHAS